jgi:hypothetical protein
MPISQTTEEHTEEYWTDQFESFIKPLVEECGDIEVIRSEALHGDILNDIIKNLFNAEVVVADLTDLNANVFWELGVRQSCRHGTITIAENGMHVPFDVGTKGTLSYYPKHHIKNEGFRKQFKKAVVDCLENPRNPDSRVLEVIPDLSLMHLLPPISYSILPVFHKEGKPRAGFIITNLGPNPAKFKLTIRAFLNTKDLGPIKTKIPYYSGGILWNLDPSFQFHGNFPLEQEWIDSEETLRLEVRVSIHINGLVHEKAPLCFTYVKEKKVWYLEPTSFDDIKPFLK